MRGATIALGMAVFFGGTSAAAQGTPTRRDLLDQADAASRAGRHAEAIAAAEAAGRMQMSPSVRMFLAEEHEALAAGEAPGRHLLDAAAMAEACVREANAQPTLNNRERILTRCTALLGRLNARIARVRVVLAAAPTGTTVRLDGEDLPEASWNTPIEVIPGERVVEAREPGGGVFRQTVRLAAGSSETVTVVLTTARDAAPGPRTEVRQEARHDAAEAPLWPRVVGWSLVGVGAVSVGVGLWQWASSSAYADESELGSSPDGAAWGRFANQVSPPNASGARPLTRDEVCDRARAAGSSDPDAPGAARLCDASAQAQAMAIAFGVGGAVLMTAGVVLVAVAPRGQAPRVAAAPLVGAGVGGVVLRGTF